MVQPTWLPEGWTLTTKGGIDTLRGPREVVEPDGEYAPYCDWYEVVVEVSVDPVQLDREVRYAQPFLVVAGGVTDLGPDDWPDVTRHTTLDATLNEVLLHVLPWDEEA